MSEHDAGTTGLATAVAESGRRVVVIDDDPTGSQSVTGLPLLTAWSDDDLAWAFDQDAPGFFVLANTRSHQPDEATRIIREIHAAVTRIAAARAEDFVLISRGDSTLRGHFPLETDVLARAEAADGRPVDAILLVPAYPEAGRITVDSVHLVEQDGVRTPVGETEYARDATFGYRSSALPDWVEEVTDGVVRAADVVRLTLDLIHRDGPDGVADVLRACSGGTVVAVDAVDEEDLRIVALGVLRAEADGARILTRSGPTYVRARCGQDRTGALADTDLERAFAAAPDGHGLVAVGSHVGTTGRQLRQLLDQGGIASVEIDLPRFLAASRETGPAFQDAGPASGGTGDAGPAFQALVDEAADAAASLLAESDVAVMTSREVVHGADAAESLWIAAVGSRALVAVVRAVLDRSAPSFVVAKGGITSNDVATGALGIRHAEVVGTVLPGIVSLWRPVSGPSAGAPYVVFPGNVGDDAALAQVVSRVRDAASHRR